MNKLNKVNFYHKSYNIIKVGILLVKWIKITVLDSFLKRHKNGTRQYYSIAKQ